MTIGHLYHPSTNPLPQNLGNIQAVDENNLKASDMEESCKTPSSGHKMVMNSVTVITCIRLVHDLCSQISSMDGEGTYWQKIAIRSEIIVLFFFRNMATGRLSMIQEKAVYPCAFGHI